MKNECKNFKVEINKLGAVDHAEINLKPLTIFVGENSTGKTYTAYVIGYLFSKHVTLDFLKDYYDDVTETKFSEVDSLIKDIKVKKSGEIDFKTFFDNNCEKFFNCICKEILPKNFPAFLGSETFVFNNVNYQFDFNKCKRQYFKQFQKYRPFYNSVFNRIEWSDKIDAHFENDTLKINLKQKYSKKDDDLIKRMVHLALFMPLHRSIFNEVYFLGAERTGMTLFVHSRSIKRGTIDEREKLLRQLTIQKPIKGFVKMSLARHVGDLLNNFQASFTPLAKEVRNEHLKWYPDVKKFIKFSEILEQKILGGKIEYHFDKKQGIQHLMFDYFLNKDEKINMPICSSAVKGLSPLVIYLKYYIEPDELLVIDEPEMNLHPKAQAELIELIAMLVNAGVHVLITTHSPYIVDHLINLIKAESSKKTKKIVDLFYLKNKDAFISKNDVSVYLFEKGQVLDILDEKRKINWETFSRISDQITDIYFEMDD